MLLITVSPCFLRNESLRESNSESEEGIDGMKWVRRGSHCLYAENVLLVLQLFQKELKMNFITFLPYQYPNSFMTATQLQPHNPPSVPTFLADLAEALRKSINRYEKECELLQQHEAELKMAQAVASQLRNDQKITQSRTDKAQVRAQKFKTKDKKNVEEKIISTAEKTQKTQKESSQATTNEEIAVNNEEGNSMRKHPQHRNKIKKDKHRHKKSHHRVRIPDITLIDTAVCPEFKMDREALQLKKESLISRQVWNWSQKLKYLRDKREIRMLNC